MRGHESSSSKDDDLKLMWFIDQAGGRTNLSVYGRFFEVAPGNVPTFELPRVHLIVPPPVAQAGDPQDFFAFCKQ